MKEMFCFFCFYIPFFGFIMEENERCEVQYGTVYLCHEGSLPLPCRVPEGSNYKNGYDLDQPKFCLYFAKIVPCIGDERD